MQNAVFSRIKLTQRKQIFAFRSAKLAQEFCEQKPYQQLIQLNSAVPVYTVKYSTSQFNLEYIDLLIYITLTNNAEILF